MSGAFRSRALIVADSLFVKKRSILKGMEYHRLTPGRRYYLLAILVLGVGIGYFASSLHGGVAKLADNMERVVVPGSFVINLDKAGSYTMFYEYESQVGGRTYATGPVLSGLLCELQSKDRGDYIQLKDASNMSEFSAGPRAGVSVFDFNVEKPGPYVLTAFYVEGHQGSNVVMSVAHNFDTNLHSLAQRGLWAVAVAGGIAITLTVFVFIRRRKAKEARVQASA